MPASSSVFIHLIELAADILGILLVSPNGGLPPQRKAAEQHCCLHASSHEE
jgi:hypothetical protein